MSRWRNLAPLCAITLCTTVLCGCTTGRVNLWPVFFHEVREVPTADGGTRRETTTEVLYPLFERRQTPEKTWHAVRPFYNLETGPEPGRYRVQYLWPLGLHFKNKDTITEHRFWPLFHYVKLWQDAYQRHSTHAHLLQILRWGNDAKWGPYFALFPLAGITHDVIADTWSFLLFPLYSYYRQGDYVRRDFPWPFLGYSSTPDGKRKQFRAWPFYVYQASHGPAGTYVRNDLLWPLLRWGRLDRGGAHYGKMFAAVPFFSTVRTYNRQDRVVGHRTTVLGFTVSQQGETQNYATGWGALWWLVSEKSTDRTETFRVFPFYWRTTRYRTSQKDPARSWTRRRILWPFIWQDSNTLWRESARWSLVLAPFYWHHTEVSHRSEGPDEKERSVTLFPLLTWQTHSTGGRHLWLLSHGWNDTTHGYKRNYRAFFDLFQYHHDPGRGTETRLLSRLYHHRRGGGGRYVSFAGLFTYDGTAEVVGEHGRYWSALFGLVKRSWTDERSRWRILYIPF